MKIIFLADIHSNWNYLSQLTNLIELENVDRIYFLGDAIGYYDEPNKILDWLKKVGAECIKGNHEKYFLNEISYREELDEIYRVDYNRQNISKENSEYIKKWDEKIDCIINGKRFLMLHGDINSSENHIYKCDDLDKDLLKNYDYYIYGHTHIPIINYYYGCCVINPGSIGQPRDYTTVPSFVVLDLDKSEVTIKKVPIKIESYIKDLEKKIFDKKVINILKRKMNGKD
ncbi:MAG: hypothetical protein COB02_14560 [Candidatus Cloacimonadota bacterium]|nr:MAG: hypothetical protein COB02_14560 [Candidatus Cloacimonadota bacterium]